VPDHPDNPASIVDDQGHPVALGAGHFPVDEDVL
jgi:hypothetical protein